MPRFIFDTQVLAKRLLRLVVRSAKHDSLKTYRQKLIASGPVWGPVNDLDQKMHAYEVRPRVDQHGIDLISQLLPFGRLLYLEAREAVAYARFYSRSHHALIRVYDEAGNLDRNARARRRVLRVLEQSFHA